MLSPQPIHPKADKAAKDVFRHTFSILVEKIIPVSTSATGVDIGFQDESRICQKGMLTRVWARAGTRPRIVRDQRFSYCHLFTAVNTTTGDSVSHVCDGVNTEEMNRHLQDLSEGASHRGKHAVLVLDQFGWHKSRVLEVPANVTLCYLPSYSPELNPIETDFQVLKQRYLSNRVMEKNELKDIVKKSWAKLSAGKEELRSITRLS